MFELTDKQALITGGGRGLGRAIAFADAGADVAVTSRTREQLDEVAEAICAKGRRAFAVEVDVSDSASDAASFVTGEVYGISGGEDAELRDWQMVSI